MYIYIFFDGRALDGVPATIDQLAEVVAEVKGEVPVYVDGGIRSGADVFKALALGKLLSEKIYVTQHHQMRHKSHTNVLSK